MLFFAFFEHCRNALTPFFREMTQEANNAPHFFILKHALPARHTAEANAVLDNPLELTVLVLLNILVAQIKHRRRHFACERNPSAVSIQTMANLAVMLE